MSMTRLWLAPLLGALLVAVGCGPVAPYRVGGYFVSPQLANYDQKTVAVLPFKGNASDVVTDLANLELGRAGRWKLIERIRVQELYDEQDFDPERIDDEAAVKIGKMLGVQAVILGQVYEYTRPRCSVSMRLVATETGEHLWQARDALESGNLSVQQLAADRYDVKRLKTDPEALASVTVRALVETINK